MPGHWLQPRQRCWHLLLSQLAVRSKRQSLLGRDAMDQASVSPFRTTGMLGQNLRPAKPQQRPHPPLPPLLPLGIQYWRTVEAQSLHSAAMSLAVPSLLAVKIDLPHGDVATKFLLFDATKGLYGWQHKELVIR